MKAPLEVRLEPLRKASDSAKAVEPAPAKPRSGVAAMLNNSPRQLQLKAQAERLTGGRAARPAPAPIQPRAPAPLPASLRAGAETLSGLSMAGVRVHYDSPEPAGLGALAFARGSDVHLGPGQERHLPHETWHVVQQAQGRVRPTLQAKSGVAINDDNALEREADMMGARALAAPIEPRSRLAEPRLPGQRLLQGKFAVQVVIERFVSDDQPVSGGAEDIEVEAEGQEGEQDLSRSGAGIVADVPAADLRIFAVHIAGRPPGLFANAEKSHSTAWALYTDQVRNAVLGRDAIAAVAAVAALAADAKRLPGFARSASLDAAAKGRYDEAETALDVLTALDAGAIPADRLIGHVQSLIRAYLTYRNLIPLSQVDLGAATGHGEPKVLKTLRRADDSTGVDWVEDPEDAESAIMGPGVPEKVRAAMWSLLDAGVIHHFRNGAVSAATTPGMKAKDQADPTGLIADVVTQHLWTLETSYMAAYREADMDDSYDGYLERLGLPDDVRAAVVAKIEAHYEAGSDAATKVNPDRLRAGGLAGQALFSVQVETSDDGGVSELHVGGRAPTPMGSDQGSHSTAWLVYVDAVRNAVVGKSVAAATGNMLGLCDGIGSLPGMARVDNLTFVQRSWFEEARSAFEAARQEATAPADPLEGGGRLQQLIRAYLSFRNAVPLSQIKGGLADANSEGRNRAKMRYLESGFTEWALAQDPPGHDRVIYRTAFWELYDYEMVGSAARGDMEPADAPGIAPAEEAELIAGDSIRQHLIAMKSAYPVSYAWLDPESAISLGYLLDLMEFPPDEPALIGRILGRPAQSSAASAGLASSSAASSGHPWGSDGPWSREEPGGSDDDDLSGASSSSGFAARLSGESGRPGERPRAGLSLLSHEQDDDRNRDRDRDRARDRERVRHRNRGEDEEQREQKEQEEQEEDLARGRERKAANVNARKSKSRKRDDDKGEWKG